MCVRSVFFFFFKQKTAYEMRISDWSSDVCSSDLLQRQIQRLDRAGLYRGEAAVEVEAPFSHQFSCRAGFFRALFRHIDIPPAGETVFQIPGGLAMADRKSTRLNSSH